MTITKIGRWGGALAVRVPLEVVRESGLTIGEGVEIEAVDGDILIRRSGERRRRRADALAAMTDILTESRSRSLGEHTIRDLIDEGRR